MPNPYYLVTPGAWNDTFSYRLISAEGKVLLRADGLSKNNCLDTIEMVRQSAACENRFERWDGTFAYSFTLRSSARSIIGRSSDYKSAAARELAILAVQRDAPSAQIREKRDSSDSS